MSYQKILFATDLSVSNKNVAEVAKGLAKTHQAQLHILHVIEPIGTYGRGFYYLGDLEKALEDQAVEHLNTFSKSFDIPKENRHVCFGQSKKEICVMAKELGADLIVIGSHGASGFNILLGSTANYVLSHASSDVLTVPLKRFEKKK